MVEGTGDDDSFVGSDDDGGGGRRCWCRSEAAVTSDEEVERLEWLQKLRSRFRKPRRGSDLPRSAPICSGDEVASADLWTWLSAAAEPWMVMVLMGSWCR